MKKEGKKYTQLILRDIENVYGEVVEGEELKRVLSEIATNTLLNEGLVDVPKQFSSDFDVMKTDDLSVNAIKEKILDVFGKDGRPGFLYLLSEEESISKSGLTRLPLEAIVNNVVPYIKEWGQMTDYWLSDGKNTMTFHRSGIVYWKREHKLR